MRLYEETIGFFVQAVLTDRLKVKLQHKLTHEIEMLAMIERECKAKQVAHLIVKSLRVCAAV